MGKTAKARVARLEATTERDLSHCLPFVVHDAMAEEKITELRERGATVFHADEHDGLVEVFI